jgi:hypothetical protein
MLASSASKVSEIKENEYQKQAARAVQTPPPV